MKIILAGNIGKFSHLRLQFSPDNLIIIQAPQARVLCSPAEVVGDPTIQLQTIGVASLSCEPHWSLIDPVEQIAKCNFDCEELTFYVDTTS